MSTSVYVALGLSKSQLANAKSYVEALKSRVVMAVSGKVTMAIVPDADYLASKNTKMVQEVMKRNIKSITIDELKKLATPKADDTSHGAACDAPSGLDAFSMRNPTMMLAKKIVAGVLEKEGYSVCYSKPVESKFHYWLDKSWYTYDTLGDSDAFAYAHDKAPRRIADDHVLLYDSVLDTYTTFMRIVSDEYDGAYDMVRLTFKADSAWWALPKAEQRPGIEYDIVDHGIPVGGFNEVLRDAYCAIGCEVVVCGSRD